MKHILKNIKDTCDSLGINYPTLRYDDVHPKTNVAFCSLSNVNIEDLGTVVEYPEYGYKIKKVRYSLENDPDRSHDVEMNVAYNMEDKYIGDEDRARYLCIDKGIRPTVVSDKHNVCSIGYSVTDGKWYGWSHRAINGFEIGHEVKSDDELVTQSGYIDGYLEQNPDQDYRVPVGFKAETLADCKRLAKAFAESVSSVSIEVEIEVDGKKIEVETEIKEQEPKETAEKSEENTGSPTPNPVTVSVPVIPGYSIAHESTSASNKNVMDYEWYRYVADRKKTYTDNHPKYDLELEKGNIFGILQGKGDRVYLMPEEDTSLVFNLTRKETELLLKRAKGYGGKVQGKTVKKGSGSLEAPKEKVNIPKKTTKEILGALDEPGTLVKERPGTIVHKLPDDYSEKPSGSGIAAVFRADRSDRAWLLVVSTTRKKLEQEIEARMKKAIDPSLSAKIIYLDKNNAYYAKATKRGWIRITEDQANHLIADSLKTPSEYRSSLDIDL